MKEKRHYCQLIQSLEEHRRGLKDGAPCPLCGATHHPYAEGNIPAVDEIQTQIDAVQKTLNEAIHQKNQLQELATKVTLQKEAITSAETNQRLVQERLDGVIEQRREALNLIDEKKEKFALDSNAFYESVSGFGLALPMSPTEVINELLAKKTLWVKNEEAFNEKQKDLERVASEIREIKSLKAEKEKTWQGKHSQFVQSEEKLNEEKRIRTELFGDKDPNQVRQVNCARSSLRLKHTIGRLKRLKVGMVRRYRFLKLLLKNLALMTKNIIFKVIWKARNWNPCKISHSRSQNESIVCKEKWNKTTKR